MKILLLADKERKEELVPTNEDISAELIWSDDIASLQKDKGADACIDLLFNNSLHRLQDLKELKTALVIVHSLTIFADEAYAGIVRFNGWKTFLKGTLIEASADDLLKKRTESVFLAINKKVEWVQGITGFISPRVIASIINEAYFALEEGVSSKEEIDTAMKLGTNYPYGPFEWSQKIGVHNVHALLKTLSATEKRYEPATLLSKEASI